MSILKRPKRQLTEMQQRIAEWIHFVLFVVAAVAPPLVPLAALVTFGALGGIAGAVVCFFFYWTVRGPYRLGGPIWLDTLDMWVCMMSVGTLGLSILEGVRSLLWVKP